MSARAPFIPQNSVGSRPPSRLSQFPHADQPDSSVDMLKTNNLKPLNLAGLRQRAASSTAPMHFSPDPNLPRRVPVAPANIHRPSTTDPTSGANDFMQIAAPAPLTSSPSLPAHHLLNNFKLPPFPPHLAGEDRDHFNANQKETVSDDHDHSLVHPSFVPFTATESTPNLTGDALRTRRRSKRSRTEYDMANESQELQYNAMAQPKKFKSGNCEEPNQKDIFLHPQTKHSSPMSIHPQHHSPAHFAPISMDHSSTSNQEFDYTTEQNSNSLENQTTNEPILDRILGRDVDSYITNHCLSRLEAAENRWKDCTLEEWQKGGDDIIAKFSGLMDKLRDHMTSKVTMYTTFDSRMEEHQNILNNRQEDLQDLQKNLVQGSGNVIVGVGKL